MMIGNHEINVYYSRLPTERGKTFFLVYALDDISETFVEITERRDG